VDGHVADWVITNPPFCNYFPILRNAYKHAKIGLAFLLRVTADEMVVSKEEAERANWWADHPESLIIKMPRFCFTRSTKGNWSTDSAYLQWHVWRKDGHQYPQPIIRLPWHRIEDFSRKPVEVKHVLDQVEAKAAP
jgi:hypothetical protein